MTAYRPVTYRSQRKALGPFLGGEEQVKLTIVVVRIVFEFLGLGNLAIERRDTVQLSHSTRRKAMLKLTSLRCYPQTKRGKDASVNA
jgi:hypothetical protein